MDDFRRLANQLYEVVIGNLTAIEAWGFYLTNREFDGEPELRNKLGTIWLCSLLDTLEADSRFLPDVSREAERKGFSSLVHNATQLQNFCGLIAEVLGKFTREEQIFLVDLRNQWVHSYFANRHREEVAVKYAIGGKIQTERLKDVDYHALCRSFYEGGKHPDAVLVPLIGRALDQKLRYWAAVATLQRDKELLYKALLEGRTIEIRV